MGVNYLSQHIPPLHMWQKTIDANKVAMQGKGQMADPITLHKENDNDGCPMWPDENQNAEELQ